MSAQADIEVQRIDDVLAVPVAAVLEGDGNDKPDRIFVYEGDAWRKVPIAEVPHVERPTGVARARHNRAHNSGVAAGRAALLRPIPGARYQLDLCVATTHGGTPISFIPASRTPSDAAIDRRGQRPSPNSRALSPPVGCGASGR